MVVPAGDAGQAFAGALPDGILVADAHGRIILATRQLAALSGYELDGELIGLPVGTLVPARHRQAHPAALGGIHEHAADPTHGGGGRGIVLWRRDGSELPVDIALRPGRLGGTGQVGQLEMRVPSGSRAGGARRSSANTSPGSTRPSRRPRPPARMLEAAIRGGRVEDEGWRMRKDGSRFWANVVVTAVYDEAGALHGSPR